MCLYIFGHLCTCIYVLDIFMKITYLDYFLPALNTNIWNLLAYKKTGLWYFCSSRVFLVNFLHNWLLTIPVKSVHIGVSELFTPVMLAVFLVAIANTLTLKVSRVLSWEPSGLQWSWRDHRTNNLWPLPYRPVSSEYCILFSAPYEKSNIVKPFKIFREYFLEIFREYFLEIFREYFLEIFRFCLKFTYFSNFFEQKNGLFLTSYFWQSVCVGISIIAWCNVVRSHGIILFPKCTFAACLCVIFLHIWKKMALPLS